eukprot:TRINITY_DN12283_c0_g1_i2.p1 TRINITY_DN12283_c0_g1~~TRINITY_DN12283_c0_g1_i2.p1  ORF type:complete len:466 (-),score=30.75 TRINITY_DN12283_c0_g1_i2:76-1410(-)
MAYTAAPRAWLRVSPHDLDAKDAAEQAECPDLPCVGCIANKDLSEVADERACDTPPKECFIGLCVRPCLYKLWWALGIDVSIQVSLLFLGLIVEEGAIWWLLFLWAPFAAAALYMEFGCLQHFVVTFCQTVRNFEIVGFRVRFRFWFLTKFSSSLMNLLNLATHTLVSASWLRTPIDDSEPLRTHEWSCEPSFFLNAVIATGGIKATILVLWLLSETKILWKVISFCPRWWTEDGRMSSGLVDDSRYYYMNCFGSRCFAGTAFFSLADAAGMSSISDSMISYRAVLVKARPEPRPNATYNNIFVLCIWNFNGLIQLVIQRLIFVGFLRIACPLALQVKLLEITMESEHGAPISWKALAPIFVALVTGAAFCQSLVNYFQLYGYAVRMWNDTEPAERTRLPPWRCDENPKNLEIRHVRFWVSVFLALFWATLMCSSAAKMVWILV